MPVKPPRSSPTDSTGVVIPNTGTLIEYDAVALELVHPRLVWGNDLPARAQTAKAAQPSRYCAVMTGTR